MSPQDCLNYSVPEPEHTNNIVVSSDDPIASEEYRDFIIKKIVDGTGY